MKFGHYLKQNKKICTFILNYIENETESNDDFQILTEYIEEKKVLKSRAKLREFIHIFSQISLNHNRTPNFFIKIKQILSLIKKELKDRFSQKEIIDFFQNDISFLLILIQEKIINLDDPFYDFLSKVEELRRIHNYCFFYPEIKSLIGSEKVREILLQKDENIFNYFENNRQLGENDSNICSLIRNDSIIEFVTYVNQTNYKLSSLIPYSFFETNSFLVKKNTTLIEYAAFFGSIQIIQYLVLNGVELTPSIWLYAIHSNNAEMIHLLETYKVKPFNNSFESCLKEAIKCYHNNIAFYIEENLIQKDLNLIYNEIWQIFDIKNFYIKRIGYNIKSQELNKLYQGFTKKYSVRYYQNNSAKIYGFQYHNYAFIDNDFKDRFIPFFLCYYDHYLSLKLLLKSKVIDINAFIQLFFYYYDYQVQTLSPKIRPIHLAINQKNYDIVYLLLNTKNQIIPIYAFAGSQQIKEVIVSDQKVIPNRDNSMEKLIISSSVAEIEENAFSRCTNLEKVEIKFSVTKINEKTFKGCTSLKTVVISPSVTSIEQYAFNECTSLSKITFSSITIIQDGAFQKCTSLTEIDLPPSLLSIESYVFNECSSLKNIIIPAPITQINKYTFNECSSLTRVILPPSVTSIGCYAFSQCKSLTEIIIPSSVKYIFEYAFNCCSSLKQISIPESVVNIDQGAFNECTFLEQIDFQCSIKIISPKTFCSCSSLTKISISNTITEIQYSAFEKCTKLTEVLFESPSSLISIGMNTFKDCKSLKKFSIPTPVKQIHSYAFESCSSLKNVNIASSVISIGEAVFNKCTSLQTVNIPNSVKFLGVNIFKDCSSLKQITIPEYVTNVKKYLTFIGISSLSRVKWKMEYKKPLLI